MAATETKSPRSPWIIPIIVTLITTAGAIAVAVISTSRDDSSTETVPTLAPAERWTRAGTHPTPLATTTSTPTTLG
ncbi:MAG: hypothetical protein GY926_08190 [bacterium]|nr:hypothetical protein [bacterium]